MAKEWAGSIGVSRFFEPQCIKLINCF